MTDMTVASRSFVTSLQLHDFRLQPRCQWDLRYSGVLRDVDW